MRKLIKILPISLLLVIIGVLGIKVRADEAPPEVVIVHVQAGGTTSNYLGEAATQEFISIYNNSLLDVDISDWCINNKSNKSILCFNEREENITLHLPSHQFVIVASNSFMLQYMIDYPDGPIVTPDFVYFPINGSSGSITASSDSLTLIDNYKRPVDNVRWVVPGDLTSFSSSISGGSSLLRQVDIAVEGAFVDTDNSVNDFKKVSNLDIPISGLYELELTDACLNIVGFQPIVPEDYFIDENGYCIAPQVDICLNIDGMQDVMPIGFLGDDSNSCYFDVCENLDGLQTTIPVGKEYDKVRGCVDHDECSNLPDNQAIIPNGYVRGDGNSCLFNILPIIVTELFPNPSGSDDGDEFIEIYNPNDSDVFLSNYVFYVGSDETNFYTFPDGLIAGAKQYMKFSDHDISFTLVNTTSRAKLKAIDDSFVDEVPAYNNPDDGESWALINDIWQYTNRPTPGAANVESYIEIIDYKVTEPEGLKPCAANQYRNPLTNRCKLMPEYEAQLVPCKDGQYRSEETNRCRSIVTDVVELAPCAEGQERNPATNRCRMIASAVASLVPCAEGQERNPLTNRCRAIASVLGDSDLVPCKEGQERNPETNRCRNIVSMPIADYAPEKTNEVTDNSKMWLILAGVGGLALGYAIWEWRHEIIKIVKKIKSLLRIKK